MHRFKYLRWPMPYLLALTLCFIALPPSSTGQGLPYFVTDLGTLGGSESKAFAVNRTGRVAGQSTVSLGSSVSLPFTWNTSTLTNIGSLGGAGGSAYAVNNLGYAVGAADTSTNESHPYIWSDIFGKKDLGIPGSQFGIALDINNANQLVGQYEISASGSIQDRAFIWDSVNGFQPIATLGGTSNAAVGINDSGLIVGFSSVANGDTHGFLLSGGVLTDIPTLGGHLGIANKINDGGQVVGYSTLPSTSANPPYHAFLWTPGNAPANLGTLGGNRSIAWDINTSGQVVGSDELADGTSHAFIYTPESGMVDLNTLVPGSGWTLTQARGINDKGQIAGFGVNPSGAVHGFLLTVAIDEIPGGEPPPCFNSPTAPIILLPRTNDVLLRPGPIRSGRKVAPAIFGRKPIYDLLKL